MDNDIVSTSREILEKFIRELHRATTYVKTTKIINAFTTPPKKYFENEEVASLFKIFGYDRYSKNFDFSKFRPARVVIAADADPDGSHITCLLFGLFLRYLPEAISSGRLFVANPPLYGIPAGKGKMKFFANNKDYVEYVQDIFCKEYEIANVKGKKYTKKEITKILYDNMDYLKWINHVCGIYAIDPELLEFMLRHRELPFKKFKSAVEKQFRFTNVTVENNTTMICGLVNSKYQTVFFNARLINDCKPIIDMLSKSEEYYVINKKKCTLYDLMILFSEFEPKNITRYKGLGEMPPRMLGESTVLPGSGRTLKQYTIDDVKEELKYMTELQSDKGAFIKGIKIKKEDIV